MLASRSESTGPICGKICSVVQVTSAIIAFRMSCFTDEFGTEIQKDLMHAWITKTSNTEKR